MKDFKYIFTKDPANGTSFTLVRTKESKDDGHRLLVLSLIDSKSGKFTSLQKEDLIISATDLSNNNKDNILVVDSAENLELSQIVSQLVTVRGLSKEVYGMDEFEDNETFYFLARIEE